MRKKIIDILVRDLKCDRNEIFKFVKNKNFKNQKYINIYTYENNQFFPPHCYLKGYSLAWITIKNNELVLEKNTILDSGIIKL